MKLYLISTKLVSQVWGATRINFEFIWGYKLLIIIKVMWSGNSLGRKKLQLICGIMTDRNVNEGNQILTL